MAFWQWNQGAGEQGRSPQLTPGYRMVYAFNLPGHAREGQGPCYRKKGFFGVGKDNNPTTLALLGW